MGFPQVYNNVRFRKGASVSECLENSTGVYDYIGCVFASRGERFIVTQVTYQGFVLIGENGNRMEDPITFDFRRDSDKVLADKVDALFSWCPDAVFIGHLSEVLSNYK